MDEVRMAKDNTAYTWVQFQKYYGAHAEKTWDLARTGSAAKPVADTSPGSAIHTAMDTAKVRSADDHQGTRLVARSSAAQPAVRNFPRKRAAPGTPELQPRSPPFPPPWTATGEGTALPTTLDALLEIKGMIYSARASDYLNWKKAHPNEPRKSAGNLIGHLQVAIRQKFHCSAGSTGQSAKSGEPKVPFAVLVGWLVEKMRAHGTDLEDGKELLWDLAQREHHLWRFTQILRKANEMELGISDEKMIDRRVLNEIMPLVEQASATAKNALRLAVGMHGTIDEAP